MIRRHLVRSFALLGLVVSAMSTAGAQGRIFVNNDEWTLSSTGIAAAGAANVTQFTRNVASWLAGGTSGSILIASGNFGFPASTIGTDLGTGGYNFSVTQNNTAAGWANRSSYSAVFIDNSTVGAGSAQLQTDLQGYVLGGGSVFINFGTGISGAAQEAANYQTFLNYFGLTVVGAGYNGIGGNNNTTGYASQGPYGSALFTGVSALYQDNGNSVLAGGSNTAGYNTQIFGGALYAAAAPSSVVPEPSTYMLMIAGLAGLGFVARRRRA